MGTATNSIQAIFNALNIFAFLYIGYKFFNLKQPIARLFGLAMAFLAFVELCILGVNMLWTVPFFDFKNIQYLVYIYAILCFFAASATLLKQKTRYFINIFLAFLR